MNDRVPYTERQHHLLLDHILADAERSGEHPALVAERRLAGLVTSPALSDRILRDIQILRDLLRDHRWEEDEELVKLRVSALTLSYRSGVLPPPVNPSREALAGWVARERYPIARGLAESEGLTMGSAAWMVRTIQAEDHIKALFKPLFEGGE